jgi:predicted ATP-grasp superfamily ATP-dependent carboligase
MSQPARHVHIVDDVPELDALASGPVMLHSLEGFLDAGNAAALATAHLLAQSSGRVVATFDVDAFYDYRARRPPMTFAENRYESYETPRLVVRLCHDSLGTPYLLLHGPEPDTSWEAFSVAVRSVVEQLRVRLTVSMGAVPMAVPHTRPVMLTNHATDPSLLVAENVWKGRIRVPASAQALLELRLGEWGHPAMGFVAHIPHYVAQFDYPSASARLLESVEVVTGLQWDLDPLESAARAKMEEIVGQIDDSEEVREIVRGLEQQYDAFNRGGAQDGDSLPLADEQDLPTGEQLGEEFERFLAGLDRPDDKPTDRPNDRPDDHD